MEGQSSHEIVKQSLDGDTERIYQPLIPPRRYDDGFKENSEYQSLSFDRDVWHEATQAQVGESIRGAYGMDVQISYTETEM